MYCQNCGIDLDPSAIYCEKCGVKVRREDATNYFQYSDPMTRYYDLEYELGEINEQISSLPQKELYLQKLELKKNELSNKLNHVHWIMQKERKDYEDLMKMSFSSLKARLKGHLDEEKRKEEAEYLEALANYEYVEKEYRELKDVINNFQEKIVYLQKLKLKVSEIEKEMFNLLAELTKEKSSDRLERLERSYNEMQGKLHKEKKIENQFRKTQEILGKAQNHLDIALHKLSSAQGLGTWDTFFGGGFFVDSMKHNNLNSAKSDINYAQSYIRQAKDMIEIVDDIHINFEAPNMFTDIFFDNFFFDMFGNAKISRTRDSVQNAYQKVSEIRENIIHDLKIQEQNTLNLIGQVNNIRKEIRAERKLLLQ
ncbi:MAG: hypothetical protein JXA99_10090 [Candidatus Lokiarchaeota archaeon]|nr:hypothetical protein [Candidatus Lokiarchaeota archaeon]